MANPVSIRHTPPQRHTAALELLFSAMSSGERVAQMATTMTALRDGRLSLDGLLEAVRDNEIVGCIWASALGGRMALVWPPQIAAHEEESTAVSLLAAADAWMSKSGVRVANAFLVDDQSVDSRRLLAAGYQMAAEILYLVSDRAEFPQQRPATQLSFDPATADEQEALSSLIEQTYADTLDCPTLNGQREMDDILEGYRQTGRHDPNRWFIVRQGSHPIGCLILTDHPSEQQLELVYQGVVPSARGHGFGLEMTRHAQYLTGQANRSRLVLAVDSGNAPAIKAYTAAGFQQWDRRFVYVIFIDRGAPDSTD